MPVPEESIEKGRALRAKLNGGAPQPATPVYETVPGMNDLILGVLYGEVWTREGLDLKSRSMVTIAVLATLGKLPNLRRHVGYALNNGVTPEQIREVCIHCVMYAGAPAGLGALTEAEEVFKERGVG